MSWILEWQRERSRYVAAARNHNLSPSIVRIKKKIKCKSFKLLQWRKSETKKMKHETNTDEKGPTLVMNKRRYNIGF